MAQSTLPLIVPKWPLPGKIPSLTNRLRRFLDNQYVSVRDWYHPLAQHLTLAFAGKEIRLIIDCTKVGFNYRLMTIGIAYKKRTLPLVWSVHKGRKGHVAVGAQLKLFRYVATLLPRDSKVWVMGDAGFESVHLLCWSRRQGWSFVIRQSGRALIRWPGQDWVKLNQLAIREGLTRTIGWVRLTQKHDVGWFFLVIHWDKGQEIAVGKILKSSRKPIPICTHGRRACPPQDCGGVWVYMELTRAMNAKRSAAYREYKEWLGEHFDASAFDLAAINKQLAKANMWQ